MRLAKLWCFVCVCILVVATWSCWVFSRPAPQATQHSLDEIGKERMAIADSSGGVCTLNALPNSMVVAHGSVNANGGGDTVRGVAAMCQISVYYKRERAVDSSGVAHLDVFGSAPAEVFVGYRFQGDSPANCSDALSGVLPNLRIFTPSNGYPPFESKQGEVEIEGRGGWFCGVAGAVHCTDGADGRGTIQAAGRCQHHFHDMGSTKGWIPIAINNLATDCSGLTLSHLPLECTVGVDGQIRFGKKEVLLKQMDDLQSHATIEVSMGKLCSAGVPIVLLCWLFTAIFINQIRILDKHDASMEQE